MSAGFFSDLDNTLLFSSRRVDGSAPEAVLVETYPNGSGGGYVSKKTLELLTEVARTIPFVPTTTRNQEQYERITFPGVHVEWAIIANGAVVLHNGERDEVWSAHLQTNVLPQAAPLAQVQAELSALLEAARLERRERVVEELFLYDFIEDLEGLKFQMAAVLDLAERSNWKVSLQGHKLYLIPTGLTKGEAARQLANRLGVTKLLGAGDSLLDASLLDAADVGWGLPGELDAVSPYPYRRILERHFAASDALMEQIKQEIT